MRQMLTEELLRLGTAQARAAEEQVQEMSIMDALWSDILESSSVSEETSKFGRAMAHASGSTARCLGISCKRYSALTMRYAICY